MFATLAAWLHNIDPYAIELWEGGPIRWYGLSYLLGFAIAYLLIRRVTRVGVSSLKPEHVGDLIVTLAIGVVVGGRLGYVLFYRPELLWTFYDSLPYWGLLAINEGGMASHGGMIGGFAASFWFALRHRHDPLFILDLAAFGAPLGLFFGRIANFINGELIGRQAPADLPWAVKFPQEMLDWPRERLVGLVRELPEVDTVLPGRAHWDVPGIIEAIQRGHEPVIRVVEPMLAARHPSQLYAAVLEGLVVFAVLAWAWRRPRKPGVIVSLAAVVYGLVRIVDEFFRRPDVHLLDDEFLVLGITRGQWLSVLLLLAGVWGVWYCRRRAAGAMGAWRRGPWTAGEPEPGKPAA